MKLETIKITSRMPAWQKYVAQMWNHHVDCQQQRVVNEAELTAEYRGGGFLKINGEYTTVSSATVDKMLPYLKPVELVSPARYRYYVKTDAMPTFHSSPVRNKPKQVEREKRTHAPVVKTFDMKIVNDALEHSPEIVQHYVSELRQLVESQKRTQIKALKKIRELSVDVGLLSADRKLALELLRELADLQNGPPLIKHQDEWNQAMLKIWPFLEEHEESNHIK